MNTIKVNYELYANKNKLFENLNKLNNNRVLSLDVETRSIYSNEEVEKAKQLLKDKDNLNLESLVLIKQIAKSSGLSCPSLIKTTHFIFGLSKSNSVIFIAEDAYTEFKLWQWIINFKNKFVTHNSLFDLKICQHRTGKLPKDFEDTMLLSKLYINNSNNFKAKVGLKHLMGEYYTPKWLLYDDYNIIDYYDKKFIEYCAIDGAATFYLWELLEEYKL